MFKKKYAKDSRMAYYFRLESMHPLTANVAQNTLHGGQGFD